jgi:hypothetical protein
MPDILLTIQESNQIMIAPVIGVSSLDQLTDVIAPNPGEGQALLFIDGSWKAASFSASDASYLHNQPIASDSWTIAHNMQKYPSVTIVDSSNDEVEGNVNHISLNQLVVTFSTAFSGRAFLN